MVFSKDLYCRHMKTRACFGKGQDTSFKTYMIQYKAYFSRFQLLSISGVLTILYPSGRFSSHNQKILTSNNPGTEYGKVKKILVTSIFSFFLHVFYPSGKLISIFGLHLFFHLQMLSI